MKVLRIIEPGKAEWQEAPVPKPEQEEVLVEVQAATACPHWDFNIFDGKPIAPNFKQDYPCPPGQPGHEMSGVVVEIGTRVQNIKVGDRIAVWRDSGPNRQGCYAQYVALPAENVMAAPRNLPKEALTSLELAMCVQVSFDQLRQNVGIHDMRLGVAGLGPAGLIAVQMAKAYGAREVVGVDPLRERRKLAKTLGADEVYAPDDPNFPISRNNETSLDVAVETSGLKISIEAMMGRAKKAVAMFGVLREVIEYGPSHWHGGFALLGYGEHNRDAADRALNLIQQEKLDLKPLISRTMPFTQYAESIALLRDRKAIKIMYNPWQ